MNTKRLSVIQRPDKSIELCLGNGVPIAVVNYRNLPWAHNIAAAVNSHEAIVNALRVCLIVISEHGLGTDGRDAMNQARAALKLAEEGERQ